MFPGLARLQGGVPWAAGRVRPQRPAPRVTPPAHRLAAQRGSGCGPGDPRGGRRSVGLASQRRLSPTGVHSPALLHKLTSRCRPPPPPRPLCPCSGDAARWAPALFVLRGDGGGCPFFPSLPAGFPLGGVGGLPMPSPLDWPQQQVWPMDGAAWPQDAPNYLCLTRWLTPSFLPAPPPWPLLEAGRPPEGHRKAGRRGLSPLPRLLPL